MATKTLITRIKNKVDTYSNWVDTTGLLDGEIAIVRVPTNEVYVNPVTGKSEPVVELLMKVGDGEHDFNDLPWLSAKASDVYDWAKAATVTLETISDKEYLVFKDADGEEVADRIDFSKFAIAGDPVIYGTADCDTVVTGLAKRGNQITYGSANVGTAITVATGIKSVSAAVSNNAYTASYDAEEECLSLTAATLTVTPTVDLNTTSITPAVASNTTAYVCTADQVSVVPAKESTKTLIPVVKP
jgi:hypothetical protein